jgi:hypothetical protein
LRRTAFTLTAAALAALAALALAATANAAPSWAPAASATIHPGVMTFTAGAQCTSNFVFYTQTATPTGGTTTDIYLGQAAHCSGTGSSTDTNGCSSGSLPVGTPVDVDGASKPGTLAYNSWITMQKAGEKDPDTCQYNDLALIKLDPADYGKVNPSIPKWGGPTGVTDTVGSLADVLSYGNSSLRLGVSALSPKRGKQIAQDSGGWNHTVYTVTPGIPGDSGSAFIDGQGRAFGVLSTVAIAPEPLSNGVGDVSREISYMTSHGGPAATLAQGTQPFAASLP